MKRFLLPFTAAALALSLMGCDNNDHVGPDGYADLRVAHLSPDAPAVDVYLDEIRVVSGAPFRAVTSHLTIEAGEHRIRVVPAGESAPVVIDATLDFTIGSDTTVAATGLLGSNDLSPIVLSDERTAPAGSARVRFVHTSPDAPAVDIAVAGGPVLFSNIAFREDSAYATVPAGTYNLEVRVAGTSTVALPVPGVSLAGGTAYTIFAVGRLSNGSLAALPAIDNN